MNWLLVLYNHMLYRQWEAEQLQACHIYLLQHQRKSSNINYWKTRKNVEGYTCIFLNLLTLSQNDFVNIACNYLQTWYDEQQSLYQSLCTIKSMRLKCKWIKTLRWNTQISKWLYYLCTTMKNCSTKIMSSCSQGKCEENRAQLKLHRNKTNNSLEKNKNINK